MAGVYPGVDLVYYGNQRQLEYDFRLAPGADPKRIALAFEGVEGARVEEGGDLVLATAAGEVRQHRPLAYQEIEGSRREVASRYVLDGKARARFELGDYDASKEVVIDPVLSFSTYFGGSGADTGVAVAVDASGNAYVTGNTSSVNFPGTALQSAAPSDSNNDIFVAKLNPAGTAVLYSSYFGGLNGENAGGLAVDAAGSAYVTGSTESPDFPVAGSPFQATKAGGSPLFRSADSAASFNAIAGGINAANIGALAAHPSAPLTALAATYGGAGVYKTTNGGASWTATNGLVEKHVNAVAFDPTDPTRAYAGTCGGQTGPPGGVYRSTDGGLNWTRTLTTFCINTLKVDSTGRVYAGGFDGAGIYKSTDGGATWGTPVQPLPSGGLSIAALAVTPGNDSVLYAGTDSGVYKSIDSGATWSVTGLSTGGSLDNSLAADPANPNVVYSNTDGVLYKTSDGGANWSQVSTGLSAGTVVLGIFAAPTSPTTLYVGTSNSGIRKSTDGGATWSATGLTNNNVYAIAAAPSDLSTIYAGSQTGADAFVTKLSPDGSALVYSTYLGGGTASDRGTSDDAGLAVAVDAAGSAYVTGFISSTDFPAVGALQTFAGQADVFVTKLNPAGSSLVFSTPIGGGGADIARAIALDGGNVYVTGQAQAGLPVTVGPGFNGGTNDAFIAKLSTPDNGATYGYGYLKYFGTSSNDIGYGIAAPAGSVYLTGITNSFAFPTLNAAQAAKSGGNDAFLTRFDSAGAVSFSTYLGGSGNDQARGVAVDAAGNAYVTGFTTSTNFPTRNPVQGAYGGGVNDAFFAAYGPTGGMLNSTYFGGGDSDFSAGVAAGPAGSDAVYVTGTTFSTNLTAASALQGTSGGGSDAFVVRFGHASSPDPEPTPTPTPTATPTPTPTPGTTFVVNSEADTDDHVCDAANCTLREAVNAANQTAGTNAINFNIPGAGAHTINATNTFFISKAVTVDATTQPGYAGTPVIEVNGAGAGQGNGFWITGGGTRVRGLVINRFFYSAVNLQGDNNVVEGCYIGTNLAGNAASPNGGGVNVQNGANNVVGGTTPAARNVLSGNNGNGVSINSPSTGTKVQGNYIGLNAAGTAALPQPSWAPGVGIYTASGNYVGGTEPGAGNVISGNKGAAVFLSNTYPGGTPGASGNFVQGNLIGTGPSGLGVIANEGGTVSINAGSSNNLVGGSTAAARNVIVGNSVGLSDGATGNRVQGNYIGLLANGSPQPRPSNWIPGVSVNGASGNFIGGAGAGAGNVISGNSGPGIWLANMGPNTAGSNNNFIQGNLIGTTPDGLSAAPNWSGGVQLNNGSSNNTIGGTDPAARNVIAGNKGGCTNDECGDGISISNNQGQSNDNVIRNNYIGVNAAGTELKNTGSAITLWGVARTQIVGNVISGSLGSGVSMGSASPTNGDASTHLPTSDTLVQGNRIGTNPAGTAAAGHRYNAVSINSSNNNTVVGNVISGSGLGVYLGNQFNNPAGATGNVVKGNFIGTNFDGTAAIPNNTGVSINGGANGNTVGGPSAADRNVISGNTSQGLNISNGGGAANNNTVQGNYVGVKADGSGALSNGAQGMGIYGVSGTQVVGNVVSGNNGGGIHLFGASPAQGQPLVPTTNTSVRGNLIGTDPTGTFAIPNSGGVNLGSLATNNTIGGPAPGDRNVISGNNGDAVNLGTSNGAASGNTVQGNYIGVNAAGTARLANNGAGVGVFGVSGTQILGNVISGNNSNGVSLGTGTVSQGSPSVGATGTVIQGNLIGTNAAGTAAIANNSNGVSLFGAANNQIGGAGAARNVISGNAQAGISFGVAGTEPNVLLPDNNLVQNNYVGVNASGTAAVPNVNGGIQMGGSSNNLIEGNVVSGNTSQGISLNYNRFTNAQNVVTVDRDAAGNVIRGNFIGTNAAGTAALPNTFNGVVLSGASNNTIGGLTAAERNIISGNGQAGVSMGVITLPNNVIRQADGNKVLGNYVGVDLNGNAMGNGNGINPSNNQPFNSGGINLSAVTNTQVSGNVVSANRGNGIAININFVPFNAPNAVADATGNTVSGNLIGTKPDGTTPLGNTGNGIAVAGSSNTIGGTAAGAGNVIANNSNVGLSLNCVSPPAGAPASLARCATNNPILSNSFFANGSIGINLGSLAGATPTAANSGQAAPSVNYAAAVGGSTAASGVLGSTPSTQFRIEFFANDSCDPSGAGEGQTFIGSTQATSDASGLATFNTSSLSPVAAGKVITATATGPNGTSRFSACRGLSPATAKIAGRATDQSGNALPGVTVSLNGSQTATATTDQSGNYAFLNVPTNGTYNVSAALAGTTFYPATYPFTNLPAGDQTVNFTKAVVKYTVTDLGALAPQPSSIAWDVNNTGQVAGWSSTVSGTNFHPFFYNGTTLTDIAPLGTGTSALAIAINDAGRVVGYSEITPGSAFHAAYSDNGGVLHDIGTLGGTASQAWGVSDAGVVVGQSNLAGNTQVRPFIWKDANADGQVQPGEMIDAGQLGSGNNGRLFAINSLGVAVGNSNTTANGVQQATIWKDDNNNGQSDPGELKLLGALGGAFGNASGINDTGYVVGVAATNLFSVFDGRQLNRAFVWHDDNGNGQSDPGEMKDLGTLGGEISSALRINAAGEIVGNSTTTTLFNASGFLYRGGFMLDLNAAIPQNSGWHITEARGINDGGQIAGYGFLPNNTSVTHALLLTPQTLASQTVTFDPVPNKTYGNAPFTVNATASSGLAVTYSVVSGPATVNGNTVTINGAGAVTLRASQAGDSTYAPASAEQSFTVAPAALRVIADSKTKLYGAPNPTFTAQYQGFKYGDGPGVLMGALTFNVTAPDAVGVYANAIVPGGLSAANYVMQYSAGTLTVEKASTTTFSVNYSLPVPGTVNLSAQVTPDAPSTQTVSGGTVTFTIRQGTTNVAQVTSGAVSAGQAAAQTPTLGTGAYTVYASYSGGPNYDGSTGLASITVGTANPVPTVTGLTPDSAVKKATETGQFTLLIDGSGFMSTALGSPADSAVDWYDRTTGQHTALSVTSITAAQIQAVVPFDLIRAGKTVEVSVVNPGPGGGTSNAQPFFITDTTATVTSSDTVLPDPVTGTASTTSVSPSGATLSAEASSGGSGGSGTLTVAQYSGDPIGTNSTPGTSAFSTADGSGYFDVYVAPGSSFTSLTLEYANTGGTTLYWWDGAAWSLVSNQSYNPVTGRITVTVTTTSSPSIAQLTGTVFGVASGPAVNKITVAPSSNVALGSAVTLTANFTDSVAGAAYTAEVNWGDGQATTLNNVTGTQLTAPHTYAAAGSYTVKVKVARGDSFGTSTFSPLVVYSAAAGWVTGGGWFNSPLGSLAASPSFTGKTFFQLGVQYQPGASVPSALNGLTLTASNMKFEATRYDWLTVVGAASQFGGAGKVNGVGGYDFLVTGFDGKLEGKKIPDKLRVKVWNHTTGQVVYDNQAGAPNTAPAAVALGGGDVTVHK